MLATIIKVVPALAQNNSLSEVWNNSSRFANAQSVGFSGLHFISNVWVSSTLYSFYIKNTGAYRFGSASQEIFPIQSTGLASSADGVSFNAQGIVMPASIYDFEWPSTSLSHQVGKADLTCSGWSASVSADSKGYLNYGPKTMQLASGAYTASYPIWIDSTSGNAEDLIATIDVYDKTIDKIISFKDIKRKDFFKTDHPRETVFLLSFIATSKHAMEFRTWFHDKSYICQRSVGVYQGQVPLPDDRIAAFPSVWKDSTGWYVAYEAADKAGRQLGSIMLATSINGTTWTKYTSPILKPFGSGFAKDLVGTPTLYRENGTWYVFFHGHNNDTNKDVCCVASGSTLTNLKVANGGNPIFSTQTWNEGTVCGKTSILKEGTYYYMAFEGSTMPSSGNFSDAKWATGLARSTSLTNGWTLLSTNPIIGPTSKGFGFDGPELTRNLDGKIYLYFRALNSSNTMRAGLVAK